MRLDAGTPQDTRCHTGVVLRFALGQEVSVPGVAFCGTEVGRHQEPGQFINLLQRYFNQLRASLRKP